LATRRRKRALVAGHGGPPIARQRLNAHRPSGPQPPAWHGRQVTPRIRSSATRPRPPRAARRRTFAGRGHAVSTSARADLKVAGAAEGAPVDAVRGSAGPRRRDAPGAWGGRATTRGGRVRLARWACVHATAPRGGPHPPNGEPPPPSGTCGAPGRQALRPPPTAVPRSVWRT
jgi:hypothetical protein